jgi:hypothetical protein
MACRKARALKWDPERAGHHEHDPNSKRKASISAELAESFEVERPELADPGAEAQTASDAGQFRWRHPAQSCVKSTNARGVALDKHGGLSAPMPRYLNPGSHRTVAGRSPYRSMETQPLFT